MMVKNFKLFFSIIIGLGILGQISSDLYLPSLPFLIKAFDTTNSLGQLSIALYMGGFTGAQLIYGPLSDGVGRRYPLLVGLLLYVIATMGCATATTIDGFLIARLVQGLGAGAAVTLSRAILRDVLSREQLARYLSFASIIAVALMASAPMIGGYFEYYFGWRFSFYFLLCYGIMMLLCAYFLMEESNSYKHLHHLKIFVLGGNVKTLLTHKPFLAAALIASFAYSGMLAWLTAGPIIIQKVLHYTPTAFGWMAFGVAVVYCGASYINSRLVRQYSFDVLIEWGIRLMLLSAVLMLIFYGLGFMNVYVIVFPMVIFSISNAFVWVNCFTHAFEPFAEIAGIATSVYSFLQIGGGFLSSTVMSYSHDVDQLPLACWLLLSGVLCLWIKRAWLLQQPR